MGQKEYIIRLDTLEIVDGQQGVLFFPKYSLCLPPFGRTLRKPPILVPY